MDSELLKARINDTVCICERSQKPKFLGFLSREQSVFAERMLENLNVKYDFFGGYDFSERVFLGCFPDWADEFSFPIDAITFTYRKTDKLTHRDFLGSLMALGLTRESIGDILIEEGRAVVFVSSDVSKYITEQVEKIGRIGVALKYGFQTPLPAGDILADFTETVSSQRLDCIVSALAGFSRSKSEKIIAEGFVKINSDVCEKTTKTVTEGDIVTIRSKGKFIIEALTDKTKKNRIILKYKKYI